MKLKKRVLAGQCMEVGKEFDLTKVEDDQAFDKAISMLDTAFQYDIRFRMPQDFDAHFNLSRRPGTSLFSFVTANLTKEQNQLVFTQAPKLEKLRVQEALFVILGQEYKSAVSHDQRLFANNRFQPGKHLPLTIMKPMMIQMPMRMDTMSMMNTMRLRPTTKAGPMTALMRMLPTSKKMKPPLNLTSIPSPSTFNV